MTLSERRDAPKSAIDGPPKFVSDGNITPDFYAVNTMQPPYQPSGQQAGSGRRSALRRSERCRTRCRRRPTSPSATCCRRRASAGRGTPAPGRSRSTARTTPRHRTSSSTTSRSTTSPTIAPGHAGARRPSQGRRHGRRRVHQGDRRRHAAAGRLLQAARQSQRARAAMPTSCRATSISPT